MSSSSNVVHDAAETPDGSLCSGATKKGAPCKSHASYDDGRCGVHKSAEAGKLKKESARTVIEDIPTTSLVDSVLLAVFAAIRAEPNLLKEDAGDAVKARLRTNASAQGTGNQVTTQEACFATLLETRGIPMAPRNGPAPPPPYYIYQPNGSQQSIDFYVVEAGRGTKIDLKHTSNDGFYLNDGWFHENVVYIVTWGREPTTFIALGRTIPSAEESAHRAKNLAQKDELNHDQKRVGSLITVWRFANRYSCERFTPAFAETAYAAVVHSLSAVPAAPPSS